jgi:cell division protein FtsL
VQSEEVVGRAPAAPAKPRLRVVDEAARRLQLARERRARVLVAFAIVVVVGSVFALAATHAFLVSGQGRLDRLHSQVADARSRYSEARLEVAELGAPARIVREARDRLGMVPPATVHYLSPSSELAMQVGATGSSSTDGGQAGSPWGSVKPYLGGAR